MQNDIFILPTFVVYSESLLKNFFPFNLHTSFSAPLSLPFILYHFPSSLPSLFLISFLLSLSLSLSLLSQLSFLLSPLLLSFIPALFSSFSLPVSHFLFTLVFLSYQSHRWKYYLDKLTRKRYASLKKVTAYEYGSVGEAMGMSLEQLPQELRDIYKSFAIFAEDVPIPASVSTDSYMYKYLHLKPQCITYSYLRPLYSKQCLIIACWSPMIPLFLFYLRADLMR